MQLKIIRVVTSLTNEPIQNDGCISALNTRAEALNIVDIFYAAHNCMGLDILVQNRRRLGGVGLKKDRHCNEVPA